MDDSLARLRREYGAAELSRDAVARDPVEQFKLWFDEAVMAKVPEPNAMTLSTVSLDGRPSARIVLLKDVGAQGFTFFTNYRSRKSRELDATPAAALVFWWRELERQVRVDGDVSRIPDAESDEYFGTRPVGSQIGAWASPQSEIIRSRTFLEERVREIQSRFGDSVPRPDFWGGYVLRPLAVEFWQGRQSRLHDRILYTWSGDTWKVDRLAP